MAALSSKQLEKRASRVIGYADGRTPVGGKGTKAPIGGQVSPNLGSRVTKGGTTIGRDYSTQSDLTPAQLERRAERIVGFTDESSRRRNVDSGYVSADQANRLPIISGSDATSPIPYNAKTGRSMGNESPEYESYLKSLNKSTPAIPQTAPMTPTATVATGANPDIDRFITNEAIQSGRISSPISMADSYRQVGSAPPPTGVDLDDAGASKAAASNLVETNQGAPVPPGGQEIMDYYDNDENKDLASIEKAYSDFYSPKNQKNNLMSVYKSLVKDSGLNDINEELIDAKRIIDGTEDDIRTEVTKASGFATDSQVQAMTNARNKTLIANYNTLLETKNSITEQIGNMMQYAQADRQYAAQQFEQRMNFEMKKVEYGRQAQQYASTQLQKIADTVGYSGLLAMTGGDPYATARVEQTLGLSSGGLSQLASKVSIDDLYKKAQIDKIYADINGGGTGGGKSISSATALNIADSDAAIDMLNDLERNLKTNSRLLGPVKGLISGVNPYNTAAQDLQSKVNSTKQIVGKYLEGGVLRAEDEKKYEKILPKLSDTPAVAAAKLANVRGLVESKINAQQNRLRTSGYNSSDAGTSNIIVGPDGNEYEITN